MTEARLSFLKLYLFAAIVWPLFAPSSSAQSGFDSSYLLDGTIIDESSAFDLQSVGTESFSAGSQGQVFNLIGESYLDVPLTLGQSILTDESFYMSVDFNMPDDGIDESARILFGNKG